MIRNKFLRATMISLTSMLLLAIVAFIVVAVVNKKYDINFIVNDEIVYKTYSAGNEKIKFPEKPTIDYYNFDGWFLDNETWEIEFKEDSFKNEKITEDINVYAKFSLKEYHIEYDVDGGQLDNPVLAYTLNDLPLQLPTPTKDYSYFEGWQYDNENIITTITTANIRDYKFNAIWTDSSILSDVVFENASYVYDGTEKTLIATNLPEHVVARYTENTITNAGSLNVTATFLYKNKIIGTKTATLTITKATYDMSNISFENATYTYDGTEKSVTISGTLPNGVTVTYINNKLTDAGTITATATFQADYVNYNLIPNKTAVLEITKATYDMSGISFNNRTFTYDGNVKSISINGTLPQGVTVDYTNNNKVNAGEYEVIASFVGNSNYNAIPNMTATLTIEKATFEEIVFNGFNHTYNGQIPLVSIQNTLPAEITVQYTGTITKNVGTYNITAEFTVSDNYNAIASKTVEINVIPADITFKADDKTSEYGESLEQLTYTTIGTNYDVDFIPTLTKAEGTNVGTYTITISAINNNYNITLVNGTYTITKSEHDISTITFNDATFTYDGTEKTITITGTLPEGVSVQYENNTLTNAGSIVATARFIYDELNFEEIPDMTAILTITKATHNMNNVLFNNASYTYDGTEKTITISGTLPTGVTVQYLNNSLTNVGSTQATAKFIYDEQNYNEIADKTATLTITKATYDISNISFTDKSYVYDGTEKIITITGTLPEGVNVEYTNNTLTNVGHTQATAIFTYDTENYNEIQDMTATLTITKATYDMSEVSFNNVNFVYNGNEKEIKITGTLPQGVAVAYQNNKLTDVGSIEATATFTYDEDNYNEIADMHATLTITKATYDMSQVYFDDATYIYDGNEKTILISGNLPTGVTVDYTNNKLTNVGVITAIATFTYDTANYNTIADMSATLEIKKATYDMNDIIFNNATFTYDGTEKTITITGTLPTGVSVQYQNNKLTNVGEIIAAAIFTIEDTTNYNTIPNKTATLRIVKATHDMSGILFNDAIYTYDGSEKSILITGTLPEGVMVQYLNNTLTNVGSVEAMAIFIYDENNYNTITNMTATLTIEKATPTINPYYVGDVTTETNVELLYDEEIEGTLTLDENQTLVVGTNDYNWTFVPQDTENYNNATGQISINVKAMVKFYNENALYDTKLVVKDNCAMAPQTNPTKANYQQYYYTFAHWSLENNGTAFDFNTQIQDNTNLYAVYTQSETEYTITYNNTLDAENNNPTTFYITTPTITLEDLSLEGYIFEGWFDDDEYSNQITQIEQGTDHDVILYAKWSLINYIITYHSEYEATNPNPDTFTIEDEIILQDLTNVHFEFVGWYLDEEFTQPIQQIEIGTHQNIDVYAKWDTNFILIRTVEDLQSVSNNLSANYKVMNDIDCGNSTLTPIGCSEVHESNTSYHYYIYQAFSGYIDGNNHTISNFKMWEQYSDKECKNYIGLFAKTTTDSVIKNLTVNGNITARDCSFDVTYGSSDDGCQKVISAGGIVGYNMGKVENCSSSSTIYAEHDMIYAINIYIGGIAGYNSGKILNCTFDGNLKTVDETSSVSNSTLYVGGICGYLTREASNYPWAEINNCSANIILNNIVGKSCYLGGICGNMFCAYIKNSHSNIQINLQGLYTNSNYFGSICGYSSNGGIYQCYSDSEIDIQANRTSGLDYIGGIVGYAFATQIINSYVNGSLKFSSSRNSGIMGGICADARSITIDNCYFDGTIIGNADGASTGASTCGGIVGRADRYYDNNIKNCFAFGKITSTTTASRSYIIGYVDSGSKTLNVVNCYYNFTQTISNPSTNYGTSQTKEFIYDFVYNNWNSEIWNLYLDQKPILKQSV